jgi:putative transposase
MAQTFEQNTQLISKPQAIRSDNCPEYIGSTLRNWEEQEGIRLDHIQPDKPQQKTYIDRTTGRCITTG